MARSTIDSFNLMPISTLHISKDTAELLDMFADIGWQASPITTYKLANEGWLVAVLEGSLIPYMESTPKDLYRILKFALENDFDWVMLVDGAQIIPDLHKREEGETLTGSSKNP